MNQKNTRQLMEEKEMDLYYDKPFVRALVKEVQKIDPSIGAVIFPETKIFVFFWNRIIIYKLFLDEFNTNDMTIKEHAKKVAFTLKALKDGLINIKPLQDAVRGFNKNKTGKIIS